MCDRRNLTREGFEALREVCFRSVVVNQMKITFHGLWYDSEVQLTPSHLHDFFEFHYILSGKIATKVNGVERVYAAGQFYIMTPGSVHSHTAAGAPEELYQSFAVRFAVERVGACSPNPELDSLRLALEHAQPQHMEDLHNSIADRLGSIIALARGGALRSELLLHLAGLVLAIGGRYMPMKDEQRQRLAMPKAAEAVLQRAIEFVEQNCASRISASDVAKAIPISYSHLARVFAQYMHSSVSEYIMRVRLDKATHLLLTTELDIGEIAEQTGFSSLSYFSYSFKNLLGYAPREFRERWHKRYFEGTPTIL